MRTKQWMSVVVGLVLACGATRASAVTGVFTGGDAGEGLDLQGNFLWAVNANGPGNFNIGDAAFVADAFITAPNRIPNWANPNYGASVNDDNLETVMQSIRWSTSPVAIDLPVTAGREYKLQLLFTESCCNRGFDVTVDGALVEASFNPGVVQGGVTGAPTNGAVVTHTFTAGGSMANIVLNGAPTPFPDKNPTISGFTLEDLSGQPIGPKNVAAGAAVIDGSGAYFAEPFTGGIFPAQRIVDGRSLDFRADPDNSYWLGREGQTAEHITIDLGQSRDVQSLVLTNTHNVQFNDRGTRDFRILASNSVDGGNQLISPQVILESRLTTSLGGNSDTMKPSDVFNQYTGLTPGSYRYLRFETISGSFNANVGLAELEVFETELLANVAAGKPIVAGSGSYQFNTNPNLGQFPASAVTDQRVDDIDGNPAGFWLGRDFAENEFFVVDLGEKFLIERIDLQNTHNRGFNDRGTADFNIQASIDGVDFFPVLTGTLANVHGTGVDIPIESFGVEGGDFSAFQARFIRFEAETFYAGTTGVTGVGLNEIFVFGRVIPEPGTAVLALLGLGALGMRRRARAA